MRSSSSKFVFWLLSLFAITGIYFVMLNRVNSTYLREAFILIICHFFMMICLIVIISKNNYYLFEPVVFVFFMYYMIFVFTPMYNLAINNYELFGCNTMSGCVKGTIIFMLGFLALLVGYYSFPDLPEGYIRTRYLIQTYDGNSLLIYSYVVWGISMSAYLLYNLFAGRSIVYMLSFGILGGGLKEQASYNVSFLTMTVYCAFVPMMNIWLNERKKIIKIIVLFVTCVPIATRGFRSVLIIPLMAPFIYRYIKNKKTPPLRSLVIVGALIILMIGGIAYTRSSLRVGEGIDLYGYNYSYGTDGMLDYFGSYKVYYGAVENYPSNYMYTLGKQLSYTITMYIPRLIWSGKPSPIIQSVIGNSTNSIASSAGAAWPNLGEYYTEFGILGVMVCMFTLGYIFNKMKKLYMDINGNVHQNSLIVYSLFLPALIPIIAYGYTAGNAPTFVFMALPLLGQKYFVKKDYKIIEEY